MENRPLRPWHTSDRFFMPHYPIMDVYTKNSDLPAVSESFSDLLLLKIIL
jgi:hypothetical protein